MRLKEVLENNPFVLVENSCDFDKLDDLAIKTLFNISTLVCQKVNTNYNYCILGKDGSNRVIVIIVQATGNVFNEVEIYIPSNLNATWEKETSFAYESSSDDFCDDEISPINEQEKEQIFSSEKIAGIVKQRSIWSCTLL